MRIVNLVDGVATPSPELMILKPFKDCYKSRKKTFMDFIAYLFFVYDPRSPLMRIVDLDTRIEEFYVINPVDKIKLSAIDKKCIDCYCELSKSVHISLLNSSFTAIDAIRRVLDESQETLMIMDEKDRINGLKGIISSVSQIPKLIEQLRIVEKMVNDDMENAQTRARGGNDRLSILDND